MLLTYGEIAGRWAEDEIVSLWETYDPDNDEAIAFVYDRTDASQLCCDCASDRVLIRGYENEDEVLVEAESFDPRLGCDDCHTVIAFD